MGGLSHRPVAGNLLVLTGDPVLRGGRVCRMVSAALVRVLAKSGLTLMAIHGCMTVRRNGLILEGGRVGGVIGRTGGDARRI